MCISNLVTWMWGRKFTVTVIMKKVGTLILFHGRYGIARLYLWECRSPGQRAITLIHIARSGRIARS